MWKSQAQLRAFNFILHVRFILTRVLVIQVTYFTVMNRALFSFITGNVIVSSIEYGLFVVRPDQDQISRAVEAHLPYMEQTRERAIDFAKPDAVCPGLVESRACGVAEKKVDP